MTSGHRRQSPQRVQRLVGLGGTLCTPRVVKGKRLVGVVATRDVRTSGCEAGEEGWARLWQTSGFTPGVTLRLAHSGSARETSASGGEGECVLRGRCGIIHSDER